MDNLASPLMSCDLPKLASARFNVESLKEWHAQNPFLYVCRVNRQVVLYNQARFCNRIFIMALLFGPNRDSKSSLNSIDFRVVFHVRMEYQRAFAP